MPITSTSPRREFFRRLGGARLKVETLSQEKADATALAFPVPDITLGGGLSPYGGPWGPEQAAHLLRRTTFGVRKDHLDTLSSLPDAQTAVKAVLNLPSDPVDPPVNNYNNPEYTDPDVPFGETWIHARPSMEEGYRIESLRAWWLKRMINGEANIQEKMTLFWHNHFATQTEVVFLGRALYLHNAMLRENCLGNFKSFVKAVTLDPCMLYFLNGYLNDVAAPDENYARELQELFTVGKEGDDSYTEDDVAVAARILTGWRVNYEDSSVYFDADRHDAGYKVFSKFYNKTIIPGNSDGAVELDALLDMIFAKEEVALFVCREIYRFFVYYKIDDAVEQDVIAPLAKIFRDHQYEIKPVMEALLGSEHFFDAWNKGCMIRNPLELTLGVLRNFSVEPTVPGLLDDFVLHLYLNYYNNDLQMMPGDPPNVAGWQAYRQSPIYYRFWITGDTIRNRNIFSDVLSFYSFDGLGASFKIDHVGFAARFSQPEDPNYLIDDILKVLLPMDISPEKKKFLKSILLSGQANDYYWTDAWNAYLGNPSDPMAYETVWFRLASLHKYIMNLAEYQLI